MTTGMDTEDISDARKSAIINNELLCFKFDFATLQETYFAVQYDRSISDLFEIKSGVRMAVYLLQLFLVVYFQCY